MEMESDFKVAWRFVGLLKIRSKVSAPALASLHRRRQQRVTGRVNLTHGVCCRTSFDSERNLLLRGLKALSCSDAGAPGSHCLPYSVHDRLIRWTERQICCAPWV